jgi:hypothetical protein
LFGFCCAKFVFFMLLTLRLFGGIMDGFFVSDLALVLGQVGVDTADFAEDLDLLSGDAGRKFIVGDILQAKFEHDVGLNGSIVEGAHALDGGLL